MESEHKWAQGFFGGDENTQIREWKGFIIENHKY